MSQFCRRQQKSGRKRRLTTGSYWVVVVAAVWGIASLCATTTTTTTTIVRGAEAAVRQPLANVSGRRSTMKSSRNYMESGQVLVRSEMSNNNNDNDDDNNIARDEEGARPLSGVENGGFSLQVRGGSASVRQSALWNDLMARLRIAAYFALWYALNVVYNIVNKKMLMQVAAPLSVGTIQFGIGALYSAILWITGMRKPPRFTKKGREACLKIGVYHSAGQLTAMVSYGAGPVSFTHIVKALEPFFSAVVSAVVFGKWMHPNVYASLIPVVAGVGFACLKEPSFSWLSFNSAMLSNLAFALRAAVSKSAMLNYVGDNITSPNLFGAVTWAAFFLSIPFVFLTEGLSFFRLWSEALTPGTDKSSPTSFAALTRLLVVSGLFHYLNNEVMYLALSKVHPVTLAVGNTMKRVFIMVATVLVFQNPVSLQAAIGSAVGISGVLVYSLTKQYYEQLESAAAA